MYLTLFKVLGRFYTKQSRQDPSSPIMESHRQMKHILLNMSYLPGINTREEDKTGVGGGAVRVLWEGRKMSRRALAVHQA